MLLTTKYTKDTNGLTAKNAQLLTREADDGLPTTDNGTPDFLQEHAEAAERGKSRKQKLGNIENRGRDILFFARANPAGSASIKCILLLWCIKETRAGSPLKPKPRFKRACLKAFMANYPELIWAH